MNNFLIPYSKEYVSQFISYRKGEEKLGEAVSYGENYSNEIKFVLVGIPEDIGPVANYGKEGAKNAWNAFLKSFLNTQNNPFINSELIHVLGEVFTEDLYQKLNKTSSIEEHQKCVTELDKRVEIIITDIKKQGKTPIVIGGGHNNCYPIIKSVSKVLNDKLNILNIDPHADLRATEGRHSGNGFSFALEENYIAKYFILGLHEEYNSTYILNKITKNDFIDFYSYNNYLKNKPSIKHIIQKTTEFLNTKKIGLEIDLDSIAYMPVSAKTPSGFSVDTLRKFVLELSNTYNFEYIHICEGAPLNEEQNWIVGKTISYIVHDIIKTKL
jgi:formiminoglutamase